MSSSGGVPAREDNAPRFCLQDADSLAEAPIRNSDTDATTSQKLSSQGGREREKESILLLTAFKIAFFAA